MRSCVARASSSASAWRAVSSYAHPRPTAVRKIASGSPSSVASSWLSARMRDPALEIRATGEVEADDGERARLGHAGTHGARDRERRLPEGERVPEPAADHERVREVGEDPGAFRCRRIDRDERDRPLEGRHAGLPVARLVEVPGEPVLEQPGAHRRLGGIDRRERRSDEVDRASSVTRHEPPPRPPPRGS